MAYTRFLFAALLFMTFAVPLSLFESNGANGNMLSPTSYLVLAITLCTVLQVVIDVVIQHRLSKQIHRTLHNSLINVHYISNTGRQGQYASGVETHAGGQGALQRRLQAARKKAAATMRDRTSSVDLHPEIRRVGEAIPMDQLD